MSRDKSRQQLGKMSRQKGKAYEREIARILREAGFAGARRTAQFCGKTGEAADLTGVPGFHIECKRREAIAIYPWMHQAEAEAHEGEIPVVIFRKSREENLVTMTLNDFLLLAGGKIAG